METLPNLRLDGLGSFQQDGTVAKAVDRRKGLDPYRILRSLIIRSVRNPRDLSMALETR